MRRDDISTVLAMASIIFGVQSEILFGRNVLDAALRGKKQATEDAIIYALRVVSEVSPQTIGHFFNIGWDYDSCVRRCLKTRRESVAYDERCARLAFAVTHYWQTGKTTGVRLSA